jgi:lysophospholipase L1-like esterase
MRYKAIQPDAKFFLVTMPRANNEKDELRATMSDAIREIAKQFDNTYLIDLNKYSPVVDAEFYKFFALGGHLNPMGYCLFGKMISSYIDWIIRNNHSDFKQVGFIGTPHKNTVDKD